MAIYHMSAQVIGRSAGRSSTASAAYRAGEKIADERTGEIHDYTRKQSVDYKEIMTPEGVGAWAKNRSELWNKVEQSEKRKDSQLAREINIAIPKELSQVQGRELVREYAQKNFVDKGMIADLTIHHADKENPHAHIMLTMREAGREGFGQKVREWNDKEQLEKWREEWAHCCNKALENEGLNIYISHKSLTAQGIERKPQIHEGPIAREIEAKGRVSDRMEMNRSILAYQEKSERLQKALEAINSAVRKIQSQHEIKPSEKKEEQQNGKFLASNFLQNIKLENERNSQEISTLSANIEYEKLKDIAREKTVKEVSVLVAKLVQESKKKDLSKEIQNSPEFIAKKREILDLQLRVENTGKTADKFRQMKDETKGFFKGKERATYEAREKEFRQEQFEAAQKLKEAESRLQAIEHNLSRPDSEFAKEVNRHNENAVKAHLALQEIKPIYDSRREQEQEQQREKTRNNERGDFER